MRVLKRNLQPYWYSLYQGTEEIMQDGMETGSQRMLYSAPVKAYGNISASSGSTINRATANVTQRPYGETVDYDRVIVTDEMDLPLTEQSVVWVDPPVEPALEEDGSFNTPYQYIVTRIAKTLTVYSLTLLEVTVNA